VVWSEKDRKGRKPSFAIKIKDSVCVCSKRSKSTITISFRAFYDDATTTATAATTARVTQLLDFARRRRRRK
jgi:hypothetical protein